MSSASLESVLGRIREMADCTVHPACGIPAIGNGEVLPDDVRAFYQACGGVDLFADSDGEVCLVPPQDFIPANPEIIGELYPEDISSHWYILVRTPDRQYLTVDTHPKRAGRIYDSFYETHGVPGESPIIALCVSDLLLAMLSNGGSQWFWLKEDWQSLGDAYD